MKAVNSYNCQALVITRQKEVCLCFELGNGAMKDIGISVCFAIVNITLHKHPSLFPFF